MSDAIRVTISDPRTGEELESRILEDDYLLICAGNRYLDRIGVDNDTHTLTVKSSRQTETIRCDYCGDELPMVKSRAHMPTTPDLQRRGFDADKIVCPECVEVIRGGF